MNETMADQWKRMKHRMTGRNRMTRRKELIFYICRALEQKGGKELVSEIGEMAGNIQREIEGNFKESEDVQGSVLEYEYLSVEMKAWETLHNDPKFREMLERRLGL